MPLPRPPAAGFAPPLEELRRIVEVALDEDLPSGDVTGGAVGARPARAALVPRQAGTIAGLVAVQLVLDETSRRLRTGPGPAATVALAAHDGRAAQAGEVLGVVSGPAATLLAAERTILNIVTHLSGVATATASMTAAVEGTGAVVRDTRKTLPGLRAAQKYAVRCGGGANHRMSLSDAILVKDNHIAALGGVRAAVEAARRRGREEERSAAKGQAPPLQVEVEVDDLAQVEEALDAGVDLVLVDNMSLGATAEAVRRAHARGARVEASGGIHLGNIRAVAETGVDYIAVGALTHSAPALDVGLDWEI